MESYATQSNPQEDTRPYIDGFVLPVPKEHLQTYRRISKAIGEVWKSYGALEYKEFVGDDMQLEGLGSFMDCLDVSVHESVVFGWVSFPSREVRDIANARVPKDPRMAELIQPLLATNPPIFDASRMLYGGFKSF